MKLVRLFLLFCFVIFFSFFFCLKKSGSRKRSFEVKVCTKYKNKYRTHNYSYNRSQWGGCIQLPRTLHLSEYHLLRGICSFSKSNSIENKSKIVHSKIQVSKYFSKLLGFWVFFTGFVSSSMSDLLSEFLWHGGWFCNFD